MTVEKFLSLMQQQKSLTHQPQTQICQGIFPVLPVDAGTDLGFSLKGLLLVKTEKVVPVSQGFRPLPRAISLGISPPLGISPSLDSRKNYFSPTKLE